MKRIYTFLFICLCLGFSKGAFSQKLIVWLSNGQQAIYELGAKPKTTFVGTDLVLETQTTSISYPLSQVLKYSYDLTPASIEELRTDKVTVLSKDGDDIIIDGLNHGDVVNMYSVDGKLLATAKAVSNKRMVISLTGYPTGVYVFKFKGANYKITKQ